MRNADVLIRRARIIDGSGNPWRYGDVAIENGSIIAVGPLIDLPARRIINADGRYLAPGLIDAHVHSDVRLLEEPDFPAAVYQGVTTHIIGKDGISYAPLGAAMLDYVRRYFAAVNGNPDIDWSWRSVGEYLDRFDQGTALNVAYLIPHGALRLETVGFSDRPATPDELRQMQELAAQGMHDGAVGLSTGLEYLPCAYADTAELIACCRPVAARGGVYVTHMRSYTTRIVEAVEETITIGREAGIPTHVSHFNGSADTLLPLTDAARKQGVDFSFDTYPYMAGCTVLSMFGLPRWVQEGGIDATVQRLRNPEVRTRIAEYFTAEHHNWDGVQICNTGRPEQRRYEGMRVSDAARAAGQPISEFVCDLLADADLGVAAIIFHTYRTESDIRRIMCHNAHMGGSDGIYVGSHPHPRGYGTFARFLAHYARDEGVLPLEDLIRHLTWHPARRFNLGRRGLIAPGFAADLIMFDLDRIEDRATYAEGAQLASGMDLVLVNGTPVLENGRATGARPGRALRGPAYRP
jgi:N-acyl-D-amino-acid deacylase